ncbi:hypothetical protein HPB50_010952 [Hyalomma asiaticum]|uniref:Uncharacterized protein n=1 Tax=Hyalomma asiaticum TaxID=266040 RepID=A0ACB7SZM8_HYAAI|nr:hypothetical protein HPB50_010952 [Hyalomma asiaticum]
MPFHRDETAVALLQKDRQVGELVKHNDATAAGALSSPLTTGAGGAGGVAESEWRGGARSGVCGYDAAACARAVATHRAGGVDVFLKRYLPFSEELRQQRQSSLLVLDRRVCPSVSGGLCDDGADDAVNTSTTLLEAARTASTAALISLLTCMGTSYRMPLPPRPFETRLRTKTCTPLPTPQTESLW